MKTLLPLTLAAALLGPVAWADPPAAPPATAPSAPATLPLAPSPPRHAPDRVEGKVAAMDMTKRTLTLTSRRDPYPVTVTLASDAKVTLTKAATLADIKVGEGIAAFIQGGPGTDIAPGAAAIDATRIMLTPTPPPARGGKGGRDSGFARNHVQGTVATVTPALTLTTPGGVTVTVNTTAATRTEQTTLGTLSDLTVGANVQARVSGDPSALVASEVHVLPARRGGGDHQRGSKPANPALPLSTGNSPAATPGQ